MPMQFDEAEEERERQYTLARLSAQERDNIAGRKHIENKLKLELELANKQVNATTRTEAVQRVLIAVVKTWTIPFALALIWAYMRQGRAVPVFLSKYINL